MSWKHHVASCDCRRLSAIAAGAIMALVAACGGGTSAVVSPSAAPQTPAAAVATTVNVSLQEFAVSPSVTSVPAGTITFVSKNVGPEDVHELVVIKSDLEPGNLPVDEDGKATEGASGVTLIGEIEDIAVGETKQADLELTPGKYVLICNIVQTEPDGSIEAHYEVGMRTAFEVK